jgi:hypothetical protein
LTAWPPYQIHERLAGEGSRRLIADNLSKQLRFLKSTCLPGLLKPYGMDSGNQIEAARSSVP